MAHECTCHRSTFTKGEETVGDVVRDVVDPELGLSVVDLGLVYDVRIDGGRVAITMTLTAPGCPLQDLMRGWAGQAIRKVPGVDEVTVALTFEPPWTPDRIAPDAVRCSAPPYEPRHIEFCRNNGRIVGSLRSTYAA